MEKIRIHKYMSQAGICSRRKAEEYIQRGLVTVNGKKAQIGDQIDPENDSILLEGEAIKEQKNQVYYKINKPRGIITTCAEHGEQNIIDIVDIKERVFPIGRLDKESDGLLLLTNDGRITNYLIHPRYEHEKEYLVETFGPVTDEALEKMSQGLLILGSYTKEAVIKRVSSGTFSIILTEGKNRQIRRMVESVGGKVKKLKRIRIENIELGNMLPGEYKPLSQKEKNILFEKLGLDQE
ncbi:MAG: rRNA pseudouridine synthase [Candidatus Gracilibacteria bacterium]|nr:rRNA pseudouridine synthase [Candidatus Gracilibacteria bacterium]